MDQYSKNVSSFDPGPASNGGVPQSTTGQHNFGFSEQQTHFSGSSTPSAQNPLTSVAATAPIPATQNSGTGGGFDPQLAFSSSGFYHQTSQPPSASPTFSLEPLPFTKDGASTPSSSYQNPASGQPMAQGIPAFLSSPIDNSASGQMSKTSAGAESPFQPPTTYVFDLPSPSRFSASSATRSHSDLPASGLSTLEQFGSYPSNSGNENSAQPQGPTQQQRSTSDFMNHSGTASSISGPSSNAAFSLPGIGEQSHQQVPFLQDSNHFGSLQTHSMGDPHAPAPPQQHQHPSPHNQPPHSHQPQGYPTSFPAHQPQFNMPMDPMPHFPSQPVQQQPQHPSHQHHQLHGYMPQQHQMYHQHPPMQYDHYSPPIPQPQPPPQQPQAYPQPQHVSSGQVYQQPVISYHQPPPIHHQQPLEHHSPHLSVPGPMSTNLQQQPMPSWESVASQSAMQNYAQQQQQPQQPPVAQEAFQQPTHQPEPSPPLPIAPPMRAPEKRQTRDTICTRLLCKLRFLSQLQSHIGGRLLEIETMRITLQNRHVSTFAVFVEVVLRGGYSKVSADKKWTEVATVLNCLYTHNVGMTLKQRYDDMGLQKLEADTILVEECLDFGPQEAGLRQAGLPSRALTPMELVVFPEYGREAKPFERERYLDARDHVLQRWCLNAEKAIEFERDVMGPLRCEFNEEILSVLPLKRAFFAMETLGFMNWGCATPEVDLPTQFVGGDGTPKSFVIIGAGLAGLACALQLSRFGHDVHLVEGRDRVGGRVYTDCQTFSAPVDLGAMLITGVQGHPASVLTHQLKQKKYAVGDACPIYSLGEILDTEMDAKIEKRFNEMLTAAAIAARGESGADAEEEDEEDEPDTTQKNSRKRGRSSNYSSLNQRSNRGSNNDSASGQQEPRSKYSGVYWNNQTNKWKVCLTKRSTGVREWVGGGKDFEDELEAASFHDNELAKKSVHGYSDSRNNDLFPLDFGDTATSTSGPARISIPMKPGEGVVVSDKRGSSSALGKTFGSECLVLAQREIDRLKRMRGDSASSFKLSSLKRLPPTKDEYSLMERMMEEDAAFAMQQSEDERRLEDAFLAWHFANLEYACAASLSKVSAANWDQDDEHDWEGSHVMLPNGFGAITEGMQRFLIHKSKGKAQVHLGVNVNKIQVNAVSGTVSVSCSSGNEFVGHAAVCTVSLGVLKEAAIEFEPTLPAWKTGAIARLGYGNLNKVTFEFDRVYWSEEHDIFGRVVHPHVGSRGECFMFWCLNKLNDKPIILALVAGDAADEQEYRPDNVVARRALEALRETFPAANIPEPKAFAVTRWRADPFSRGTYSFVAVGSSGEDYNLLAEQTHDGRVYFAGEATCREHPATTGGALLSGLREAGKIAAKFGRVVTVGQAEEGLKDVLDRIGEGLSLRPGHLPKDKQALTNRVLSRLGQGKIWNPRDFESFYSPHLATEAWHHVRFPPNFLQTNRERALRANEILPRLPQDWDETRKLAYVAERLGMSEWKQGEEIGCWV